MNRTNQTGITLIEVLVTFFVMTIGLLGLAGMQSTSVKDGLDTSKRSQVMWLVSELVDRARANPGSLDNAYEQAYDISACASSPPNECADTFGNNANSCSASEMATYDVWEVFCGTQEDDVIANSVDSLNLSSVSMSCDDGTCAASDMTVTISWVSQAVQSSSLLRGDTSGAAGGSSYGDEAAIAAQETQSVTMTVRL